MDDHPPTGGLGPGVGRRVVVRICPPTSPHPSYPSAAVEKFRERFQKIFPHFQPFSVTILQEETPTVEDVNSAEISGAMKGFCP